MNKERLEELKEKLITYDLNCADRKDIAAVLDAAIQPKPDDVYSPTLMESLESVVSSKFHDWQIIYISKDRASRLIAALRQYRQEPCEMVYKTKHYDHWIDEWWYECSACETTLTGKENYCPNCGRALTAPKEGE